jgi:hypothetical protein
MNIVHCVSEKSHLVWLYARMREDGIVCHKLTMQCSDAYTAESLEHIKRVWSIFKFLDDFHT